MASSDEESNDDCSGTGNDFSARKIDPNKRSCASLLPSSSMWSPSDFAPCLLALPGSQHSDVNESRLSKCILLGLKPDILHWLMHEFGSELLSLTLVSAALMLPLQLHTPTPYLFFLTAIALYFQSADQKMKQFSHYCIRMYRRLAQNLHVSGPLHNIVVAEP
jgi:hypothetical protein